MLNSFLLYHICIPPDYHGPSLSVTPYVHQSDIILYLLSIYQGFYQSYFSLLFWVSPLFPTFLTKSLLFPTLSLLFWLMAKKKYMHVVIWYQVFRSKSSQWMAIFSVLDSSPSTICIIYIHFFTMSQKSRDKVGKSRNFVKIVGKSRETQKSREK